MRRDDEQYAGSGELVCVARSSHEPPEPFGPGGSSLVAGARYEAIQDVMAKRLVRSWPKRGTIGGLPVRLVWTDEPPRARASGGIRRFTACQRNRRPDGRRFTWGPPV
jgi:hypothetical protein